VLANRSVYFDFDSYVVREDGKPVVKTTRLPDQEQGRKILIQGNTDERGGTEYNLALGQKRAEAVRKSMTALGVSKARWKPCRWAKKSQKPWAHEAAWAENRRADIVYK
jgi:peptidoglycan-associated lipoprotein